MKTISVFKLEHRLNKMTKFKDFFILDALTVKRKGIEGEDYTIEITKNGLILRMTGLTQRFKFATNVIDFINSQINPE